MEWGLGREKNLPQSKGKERKVRLNHTLSVPLPDLDHQIARTDIDNGTFFSLFCRFGYKTLLLIEFFCQVCLDVIRFCFWVFGISFKMIVFSILDICFCFIFCLFFQITEITKNIDLDEMLKHRMIERDTKIVFVNVVATSVNLASYIVSSLTIEEKSMDHQHCKTIQPKSENYHR